MGDRGNIIVKSGNEQVCLYTHWGGSELPGILQEALAKKQRWDDDQYLARIIFCQMLISDDEALTGETGFGISQTPGDDDHTPIVVDVDSQTVTFDGAKMSFDLYIELKNISWATDDD